MPRYLLPLTAVVMLAAGMATGWLLKRPSPELMATPPLGSQAPAFTLPRVLHPEHTLSTQDLHGQVTLLNVWASWCISCKKEHPFLLELAQQEKLPIYSINYLDELGPAQTILRNHGNPYVASAFDHAGLTGAPYGIAGTPVTFVLDKQGRVQYKHLGPLTKSLYQDVLSPLIKQLQNEPA